MEVEDIAAALAHEVVVGVLSRRLVVRTAGAEIRAQQQPLGD